MDEEPHRELGRRRRTQTPPGDGTAEGTSRNDASMSVLRRNPAPEDDSVVLKFVNTTPYVLKVRWHRFNNKEYDYGLLSPKTFVIVKSFVGHKWSFRNEFDDYMIPRENLPDNGERIQYYVVPAPFISRNTVFRHFQVFILNRIYSLAYQSIKKILQIHGKNGLGKLQLPPSVKKQISEVAKEIQSFKTDGEVNRADREARNALRQS